MIVAELRSYFTERLLGDFLGGVTATVVCLPISLAFGIASGLGASAGLWGAISAGFFASIVGGTKTQITGPTAPMAVAVSVVVTTYASTPGEAFSIVVMAGILQLLLGASTVGRYVAYTPRVVVSGFMSAIGIIVMTMQLLPLLGSPLASGGAIGALKALPAAIESLNYQALIVGLVTLLVAIIWPQRLNKFMPSLLMALIVGTSLSLFWLDDVQVIGAISAELPSIQAEFTTWGFVARSFEPALILALIGAVDSLITSVVADTLTGTKHKSNRELFGQGIGNIAAGLIGGLACSGTTTGTVTNIRAGGRTIISGILYALFLIAIVVALGHLVEPIPLAALAGVLIKVGWGIIDWRIVSRVHLIRRDRLLILVVTLLLTIFVDLLTAVAVGLITGAMAHARTLEKFELDHVISVPILDQVFFAETIGARIDDPFSARVGLVSLEGMFSVASSSKLVEAVAKDIQDHEIVIFDFDKTTFIDDSIAMTIEQLIESADQQGTGVIVTNLRGDVQTTVNSLNILQLVPERRITESMEQAKIVATEILEPQLYERSSIGRSRRGA